MGLFRYLRLLTRSGGGRLAEARRELAYVVVQEYRSVACRVWSMRG